MMKRFLYIVCIVIISFLLPLYVMQCAINHKAKQAFNPPFANFNYALYDTTINADIVIFGNSRAQCHYCGDTIGSILHCKCFNLGLNGYSFDFQYHLMMLPYLQHNKRPQLVIVEIGPHAFFEQWNGSFSYHFLPYLNNPYFQFYIDNCEEVSVIDKYLPTRYRSMSITELQKFVQSMEIKTPYQYSDCFTPRIVSAYHTDFGKPKNYLERDPNIVNDFTECIKYCNGHEIPLVLVCSPMHKETFYDQCMMKEFLEQIDSLAPNIPIMNYSLLFGNDTTYFAESTHLNLLGAEIFSARIAHDIDSIGYLRY